MLRILLPAFFIAAFVIGASAQKYTLTGAVVTDSTLTPLEAATIMLLNPADSSLVSFGRSDEKGKFDIKGVSSQQAYLLRISYVGYQTTDKQIPTGVAASPYDIGLIRMESISTTLGEVTVKAEHIPVMIKKDTVEFNAQAFKTRPNDMVEDLLKKLPGVEVDQDGSVKAQGETVRQVMVDGKEFFGRDPKVATQNLPADAVDKVQVFDKKSDQANFSGIDDGQSEKAINLKLKPDKKKGVFGNLMAGYGTDGRYEGRAGVNRFNDKQQLSFLGMANNVNKQGFSIDDYLNFTGQLQRMRSGGGAIRLEFNSDDMGGIPLDFNGRNGLTTSWAAGLNFNRQMNPKTEVNGSYFYNRFDNDLNRDLNRQTFLSDQSFGAVQSSKQGNINDNHRLNITLDHKIDSTNQLKYTTSLTYNDSNNATDSDSKTYSGNNQLQNTGKRTYLNEGQGTNWTNNLLYRHKFDKKGRTFSAAASFNMNNNDRSGNLSAVNQYFEDGNLARTDSIRQVNTQTNDVMTLGANASYTEPLGRRKYLEFNYAYDRTATDLDRQVFDVDNGEKYFNSDLSNRYKNVYDYHRGGLNFRIVRKDVNFSTGLQVQRSGLDGELLLKDTSIARSFTNWLPNVRFNYDITSSRHVRFTYETSVQEPSIEQLQPLVDNTDPLNIYIGNPNLQPEYAHQFDLNYASFNPGTFVNFFANLSFRYTTDRIAEAQTIDEFFVRTWQPVNVKDDYNLNGFANFGFPIRKLKSRVGLSTDWSLGRGLSLVNGIENQTKRLGANAEVNYEFTLEEKFDFTLSGSIGYNRTSYSLSDALDQDYINQRYSAGFNWYLPAGFALSSNFDYSIYNGLANGYNLSTPIWGAFLSKYVLKKRGELKIGVNDMLNRNVGISRNTGVNYIEDVRVTSLGRYGMLSFTYSLNPAGGQGSGVRMRFIQRR